MSDVKVARFKHCPECGSKYPVVTKGLTEILCLVCDHTLFFNRKSVTTLLIPDLFRTGLWLCKRGDKVHVKPGLWGLPGGYSMVGETLRVTGSRETKEEIQILISNPEENIRVVDAHTSTQKDNDLIFGLVSPESVTVHDFVPGFEISERRFFHKWEPLPPMAFNLHEMMIRRHFGSNR